MMKMFKRSLALFLALAVLFSLSACERKTPSGYYVDDPDMTGSQDNGTGEDGTGENEDGTDSTVSTDRTDGDIWKIKRDVEPQAKSSIMKNLNFGGKTIRYLNYNSNYTEGDKKLVKEFQQKYNCKLVVDIVNYEDYPTILASSLASGKAYDIIKLHEGFFPLIGTQKLGQPMETAISKEDLTSKTKKYGINWEATMMNGSWNNHIYYVLDHRVGALQFLIYNKLLFKQYGLEDPLELYKKGKWTVAKMEEQAKIVNASGGNIKYHNDAVSSELARLKYPNSGFTEILKDGTVKWLGANSNILNYYKYQQQWRSLGALSETTSSVARITNGECMIDFTVAEQMNNYVSQFKTSQAFSKDLKNVGFVPMPLGDDGKYTGLGCEGFAAARGCDPKAAVAMAIFYSMSDPAWYETEYPVLEANKELFNKIYDNIRYRQAYVWRAANGKKGDELIYPMYGQIDKGGDIMKLAQEYAPTFKSAVEYTLSRQ